MIAERIRRFASSSAMAAAIAILGGCGRTEQAVEPDPSPEEIPVGAVMPLTGRFSAASPPMENGMLLAVEEINGAQGGDVRLRLIPEDGQSTVDGALQAFDKLIHEDEVPVILGPASSSQVPKAFSMAQRNEVVAISPIAAASGLSAAGDFVFRTNLATDVLIPNGVRVTREKLGYQQVATLFDDSDLFSQVSDAELKKALAGIGVEILATESFRTGETDFSAQFDRLKASAPEAIFISSTVADIPDILIQGRELGVPFEIPFIVNLSLSRDLVEAAGDAAEGAITFSSWDAKADTPGNRAFVRDYTARYGAEPNIWAAQCYAAVHILAKAMEEARPSDPGAIAAALAGMRGLDTILGEFSFNAEGDAVYDPVVLIVRDGEFELFE